MILKNYKPILIPNIWNCADENADLKSQLADLNRKYHELEIEFRRLENEREELAAAYKESEAVRQTNSRPNKLE